MLSKASIEQSLDAEYERLTRQIDKFKAKSNSHTNRESQLEKQVQALKEKAQILKKREVVLKDKKVKLAQLEEQVATKS